MTERIQDRIRAAMGDRHAAPYAEIIDATFPEADYPQAFLHATRGGPPGCAIAFSAALRRMGWVRRTDKRTGRDEVLR